MTRRGLLSSILRWSRYRHIDGAAGYTPARQAVVCAAASMGAGAKAKRMSISRGHIAALTAST